MDPAMKKTGPRHVIQTAFGVLLGLGVVFGGFYVRQDIVARYATTELQPETIAAPKPITIAAVGDISCPPDIIPSDDGCQMAAVRDAIVRAEPDYVLVLGDLQYNAGEPENFSNYFAPLWQPLKAISYAVPGNHEYGTMQAAGYFDYWNDTQARSANAGERGKGYYSFDIDNWHITALNSNCEFVGGCQEGAEQTQWLQNDIAAHQTAACSLAFWHHPLFTSGRYAQDRLSQNRSAVFWEKLVGAGTEIVLNGHDHIYERFALQDGAAQATPQGIRQFTVGTGGYGYKQYQFQEPRKANHEFGARTFGFLQLELKETSYAWQFVDTTDTVLDHGVGRCQ
jgi:3',5'-cyclic AMP phosphodiesterase CpdA